MRSPGKWNQCRCATRVTRARNDHQRLSEPDSGRPGKLAGRDRPLGAQRGSVGCDAFAGRPSRDTRMATRLSVVRSGSMAIWRRCGRHRGDRPVAAAASDSGLCRHRATARHVPGIRVDVLHRGDACEAVVSRLERIRDRTRYRVGDG